MQSPQCWRGEAESIKFSLVDDSLLQAKKPSEPQIQLRLCLGLQYGERPLPHLDYFSKASPHHTSYLDCFGITTFSILAGAAYATVLSSSAFAAPVTPCTHYITGGPTIFASVATSWPYTEWIRTHVTKTAGNSFTTAVSVDPVATTPCTEYIHPQCHQDCDLSVHCRRYCNHALR